MARTDFTSFFNRHPCILAEGAIIERLRRSGVELDPHIVNSGFVYDDEKRAALEAIDRQYLDIGRRFDLPLMLSTATWRAGKDRIAAAGYADRDVNGDNFRFLDGLRSRYGDYANKVVICGLMSCAGDAYHPEQALDSDAAKSFHAWQADRLAATEVDFLLAATLPAYGEALGLAATMAATGKPYIVSFIARPEGTLLDGTALKDAVDGIDAAVHPQPLAFMVNCTHASIFKKALLDQRHSSERVRQRMAGLLGNTAAKAPEDLDNSDELVTEAPENFGRLVGDLHHELGMKILGGCCGTDDRHIQSLARRLAGKTASH